MLSVIIQDLVLELQDFFMQVNRNLFGQQNIFKATLIYGVVHIVRDDSLIYSCLTQRSIELHDVLRNQKSAIIIIQEIQYFLAGIRSLSGDLCLLIFFKFLEVDLLLLQLIIKILPLLLLYLQSHLSLQKFLILNKLNPFVPVSADSPAPPGLVNFASFGRISFTAPHSAFQKFHIRPLR